MNYLIAARLAVTLLPNCSMRFRMEVCALKYLCASREQLRTTGIAWAAHKSACAASVGKEHWMFLEICGTGLV